MKAKKQQMGKVYKLRPRLNRFYKMSLTLLILWGAGLAVLLGSLLLSCARPNRPQLMPSPEAFNVFRQVAPASVKVEVFWQGFDGQVGATGSGTVIWGDGELALILTCRHVVWDEVSGKPVDTVSVISNAGVRAPAAIEKLSDSSDLALLIAYQAAGILPIPVAKKEPDIYDHVYLLGSPAGYQSTAAEGILTNKDYTPEGESLWQVTSFVFPGSSGGTMTNEQGELVGVPKAVAVAGGGIVVPQIGFAVPLPVIRGFLKSYKVF